MNQVQLARMGGPAVVQRQDLRGLGRWPEVLPEDLEAVQAVLTGSHEPWGFRHPAVRELQESYRTHSRRGFCLAVASGTSALHLAVAASGVQPGDEVITSSLGFIASAACILHHNALPVFTEVDPRTFNLDPTDVEARITSRTKAILAVDLLGLPADHAPLKAIAERHGLVLIEDASQSQGATYQGTPAGGLGHISALSVMASKNLPSCGEGGLITTDDPSLAKHLLGFASLGMDLFGAEGPSRISHQLGFNYRPTPTSTAFVTQQLRRLPRYQQARQARAARVSDRLAPHDFLRAPHTPEDRTHAWQMYRVTVEPEALDLPADWAIHLRDALVFLLRGEGVPTGFWEEELLPAMPVFAEASGYGKGCPWSCHAAAPPASPDAFPIAQAVLDSTFFLPLVRATTSLDLVDRVGDAIDKIAAHPTTLRALTGSIAKAGGFTAWSGASIRNARALQGLTLRGRS